MPSGYAVTIGAAPWGSPLTSLAYSLGGALLATALGILYRLYRLNTPGVSAKALPVYNDDFGRQVRVIEFIGTGIPVPFTAYCTSTEVVEAGKFRFIVKDSTPGNPFSLSRTERKHLPIVRYDPKAGSGHFDVSIATKREHSIIRSGNKFRIGIVAYAGMVKEEINLICWIDGRNLHIEECAKSNTPFS